MNMKLWFTLDVSEKELSKQPAGGFEAKSDTVVWISEVKINKRPHSKQSREHSHCTCVTPLYLCYSTEPVLHHCTCATPLYLGGNFILGQGIGGLAVYCCTSLYVTSTLEVVVGQGHSLVALLPGKTSDTYFRWGWLCPRSGMNGAGNLTPTPPSITRIINHPDVASHYTDWAISALCCFTCQILNSSSWWSQVITFKLRPLEPHGKSLAPRGQNPGWSEQLFLRFLGRNIFHVCRGWIPH
jgi:hypothetical protein